MTSQYFQRIDSKTVEPVTGFENGKSHVYVWDSEAQAWQVWELADWNAMLMTGEITVLKYHPNAQDA